MLNTIFDITGAKKKIFFKLTLPVGSTDSIFA